jgi:hypothetical protein
LSCSHWGRGCCPDTTLPGQQHALKRIHCFTMDQPTLVWPPSAVIETGRSGSDCLDSNACKWVNMSALFPGREGQ